jgi:amino acid adenylation domain-containing protein
MNDFAQRLANLSAAQRALLQQKLQQKEQSAKRKTIPHRDTTQPTPLSFTQQRLWFLAQLEPESTVYNIADAVRVRGHLNVEVLQQTLSAIAQRHEILRTTIGLSNGEPVQIVGNPAIEFAEIDLRSLLESEREIACQQHIQQVICQPFDLAEKPLWRMVLLRLDQAESVLLLVQHHLISDGWSIGIFWQELGELYEAVLHQHSSSLAELPIQYGDFALWQHQQFETGKLRSQFEYWTKQLGGTIPVLELPTNHARPAVQTFTGADYRFIVPEALTTALTQLAKQEQATLFMVLLAAFNTLLYRYTQQEDIWIGTPIANRNLIETEPLIGFFANTLVLRSDLSGQPTFRTLVKRVREMALDAYSHQDFPFEKLVQALQPERSLSQNPLFQTMFAMRNLPEKVQTLSGPELQPMHLDRGIAKFDLTLEMSKVDGQLQARFEYNTDLFEPETIERMSGHLLTLLSGIVQNCDRALSELPLLTEAERYQSLVEWNKTESDYPDCCLHQLFEAQVEKTPDAIAVEFEAQTLTYQELNQRANQLAHRLRHLGVVPNQFVGLCVDRSLDMIVGMLGILKAGGAYVPLDPTYPRSRLALMLEDAQLSILVTQSWQVDSFQAHPEHLIYLDQNSDVLDSENPTVTTTPSDRAYLLYTSGSTGKPKGVMIAHQSLVNAVWAGQRFLSINASDTWVAVASFCFDVAAFELYSPLIAGAKLVIAPQEVVRDGKRLAALMQSSGATIANFTPATWQILLGSQGQRQPHLRILCGGEALSKDLASRLLAHSDCIWNLYGPTETTIYSTIYRVTTAGKSPAIGRAIANTQLYVLDRHLQPLPIGVPGELHIGGDGLAIAYLNRPELTAERFIPIPPSLKDIAKGTRLYKTGDLVRYLPDGNVEYLGRIDHQVKIRGFRIELGEIEAVLIEHEAVQIAVAMAREDQPGEKMLVAYVVLAQPVDVAELRSFLKSKLPDYMIPNAIVVLDTLPLTPTGKIDRRSLPVPTHQKPESDVILPRTPIEATLAAIWQQILGLKEISVNDNFFELGGHSLMATRIITRIDAELQVNLPLRCLFESPTIADLAIAITQQQLETLEDEELLQLLNQLEDESDAFN